LVREVVQTLSSTLAIILATAKSSVSEGKQSMSVQALPDDEEPQAIDTPQSRSKFPGSEAEGSKSIL
jgi:hypothetical protein